MMRTSTFLPALLWILAAAAAGCAGDSTDIPAASHEGHDGHAHGPGMVGAATAAAAPAAALRTGVAKEIIKAAGYVYVLISGDGGEAWIAAPETPIEVGTRVESPIGNAMPNFRSTALDRTFEEVWFVSFVRPEGSAPAAAAAGHGGAGAAGAAGAPHGPMGGSPAAGGAPPELEKIEPLADGVTVAAVFTQPAGTPVALRGLVVKVNRGILGFDWIHLQDGTGSATDKTNDLLVTAAPGTTVNPGDVAIARGTVATNKDFGSGYSYALIVENATVAAE